MSYMKRLILIIAAAAISMAAAAQPEGKQSLKSPDGALELQFTIAEDGTPFYSLYRGDEAVVLPSRLGYELRGRLLRSDFESKTKRIYGEPVSLYDGFRLDSVSFGEADEYWEPVWGEESRILNRYNEMAVALSRDNGVRMTVRFRLFDDGLGFRYEFPQENALTYFVVKEELTEFAMPADHRAIWITGDYDTEEYAYNQTRLSEIRPVNEKFTAGNASQTTFSVGGVQTAIQMMTDSGLYVNIHEAGVQNYPVASLDFDDATMTFRTWLTPDAEGWKGHLQAPCNSPWRTVMVVDDARKVLASRLILNLNEPCAIEDVSWIHPNKYMGVWWEMITGKSSWSYTDDFPSIQLGVSDYSSARPHGRHGASNENVRRYIDFAADNGFDAILVEGWNEGWEDWFGCQKDYVFDFVTPYPDFDIEALNAYAHSKGIRIIMHHETSSSVRNYERHMEAAYDLMNKYGYDAVKSGYVGDIIPYGQYHYSQEMVDHYLYAVKEAAKHHIMVNAHEAARPSGLCRTWPNLVGNESAMGTEFREGIPPGHTTILPFTRLQGGPMDYTPGIFEQDMSKLNPGNTDRCRYTICNQLGLYVTFYSPLQMAADLPEHYGRFPDAFQFIKDVAVDWEESRYLLAEPGDYIVTARKPKLSTLNAAAQSVAGLPDGKKDYLSGAARFVYALGDDATAADIEAARARDTWYVGGVTDENERTVSFPLDFLKKGVKYEAVIYADAPDAGYDTNPQAYTITRQTVTSKTVMKIRMARGGGFAMSVREK